MFPRRKAPIIVSSTRPSAAEREDVFLWTEPFHTVTFGTKYPMRRLNSAAHHYLGELFFFAAPVDFREPSRFVDRDCSYRGPALMAHTLR